MTEENKTVEENNMDVPGEDGLTERMNRIVSEYTELYNRLSALDAFLHAYKPGDNEDGTYVNPDEYGWMVAQHLAMYMYSLALEQRVRVNGFDIQAVDGPEQIGE